MVAWALPLTLLGLVLRAAAATSVLRAGLALLPAATEHHARPRRAITAEKIADLLKKAYKNPGMTGDVLYSARRFCRIYFDFDYSLFQRSTIMKAELRLYKLTPKNTRMRRGRRHEPPPATHARVSVHQVLRDTNFLGSTRVLDSRLVEVGEQGWVSFDVTAALRDWVSARNFNRGVEVWVESARMGRWAARVARRVRFVKPNSRRDRHKPSLVVYFRQKQMDT